MDKLLRLRGIPDTADAWPWLQQLCVDIINTGKVGEFFQHRENEKVIHTEGHRGLLRNERKNFTAEKIQEEIHAEDAEEEIFSSPSPDSYLNPRFLCFPR